MTMNDVRNLGGVHVGAAALVAIVIAVVAVSIRPAAGESSADAVSPPVITSVQVDLAQQTLTVNGVNFGASAPTVSLALTPMTVATPTTASLVQASLSTLATLKPGTYRLVLQRSDSATADLPVTIGAVGPPGPAGSSIPVYQ